MNSPSSKSLPPCNASSIRSLVAGIKKSSFGMEEGVPENDSFISNHSNKKPVKIYETHANRHVSKPPQLPKTALGCLIFDEIEQHRSGVECKVSPSSQCLEFLRAQQTDKRLATLKSRESRKSLLSCSSTSHQQGCISKQKRGSSLLTHRYSHRKRGFLAESQDATTSPSRMPINAPSAFANAHQRISREYYGDLAATSKLCVNSSPQKVITNKAKSNCLIGPHLSRNLAKIFPMKLLSKNRERKQLDVTKLQKIARQGSKRIQIQEASSNLACAGSLLSRRKDLNYAKKRTDYQAKRVTATDCLPSSNLWGRVKGLIEGPRDKRNIEALRKKCIEVEKLRHNEEETTNYEERISSHDECTVMDGFSSVNVIQMRIEASSAEICSEEVAGCMVKKMGDLEEENVTGKKSIFVNNTGSDSEDKISESSLDSDEEREDDLGITSIYRSNEETPPTLLEIIDYGHAHQNMVKRIDDNHQRVKSTNFGEITTANCIPASNNTPQDGKSIHHGIHGDTMLQYNLGLGGIIEEQESSVKSSFEEVQCTTSFCTQKKPSTNYIVVQLMGCMASGGMIQEEKSDSPSNVKVLHEEMKENSPPTTPKCVHIDDTQQLSPVSVLVVDSTFEHESATSVEEETDDDTSAALISLANFEEAKRQLLQKLQVYEGLATMDLSALQDYVNHDDYGSASASSSDSSSRMTTTVSENKESRIILCYHVNPMWEELSDEEDPQPGCKMVTSTYDLNACDNKGKAKIIDNLNIHHRIKHHADPQPNPKREINSNILSPSLNLSVSPSSSSDKIKANELPPKVGSWIMHLIHILAARNLSRAMSSNRYESVNFRMEVEEIGDELESNMFNLLANELVAELSLSIAF